MNASNRTASIQSDEPLAASDLTGLRDNTIHDPYILRGLVWCCCSRELVAVLTTTGIRYYCCHNKPCKQTLVPAEALEQLAWQRFRLLNEAVAAEIKRNERQQALRQVLKRVTVHSGLSTLKFEWRD